MASNIVKFCAAALAGSIIGVTYERWPIASLPETLKTGWSGPISSVSASGSSLSTPPTKPPFEDVIERSGGKITPVDPKISAQNFRLSSRFGLPSKDNLRLFNDFIISYDRRLRSPIWIIEHLTPEKLAAKNDVSRKFSKFTEDTTIHEYFRATLKDFRSAEFDRGHMAAAGNHKVSQIDMDQTFILSNVSPQERKFNQGAWESLESYVRWRAKRSKNLYVVTGPLYLPRKAKDGNLYVKYRVIGDNLVSVPTHYFKVILAEAHDGVLLMEAFLMPNDPALDKSIQLDNYRVPIKRLDVIERASGIIFFDQLPRDQLEAPLSMPKEFKPRIYDDKSKVPSLDSKK